MSPRRKIVVDDIQNIELDRKNSLETQIKNNLKILESRASKVDNSATEPT